VQQELSSEKSVIYISFQNLVDLSEIINNKALGKNKSKKNN